ncbi:MAG: hypothetical protein J0I79_15105 [Mesorhizobium sp.]|uniref:hypothetical protein n=1 Tax=Mesorhizobium sp. TaxID=1871066 RepID=UPI001AC03CBD|nr:hypothetical protein [Mesorhizobium sp.]MBN9219276.1 hypothetical protein [Mesorhizobium sp.]
MLRVFSAFVVLAIFWVNPARAGIGEQFGARDPAVCPETTSEPSDGPISAEQASVYVLCEVEYYSTHSGDLKLAEFTPIEVGEPRTFNIDHDPSAADSDQPIQDIYAQRYITYTCSPLNDSNQGSNCTSLEIDNAEGECFKTRQGLWRCVFAINANYITGRGPPPQ